METLFRAHKLEMSSGSSEWEERWVVPIVKMSSENSSSFQVEHVLTKLLKCSPTSLSFIISELVTLEAESSACRLRALLVAAKTARHLGLVKQLPCSSSEYFLNWNDLFPGDLLKLALCHVDDEIRLDAFALLCDSPKTTEVIPPRDLDLICAFLPYNLTNQTPAFRQKLLALLKKLLVRINDGGLSNKRKLEQAQKFKIDSDEQILFEKIINSYKVFLTWLCSKLFESLYPGANFPRRGMVLNILKLVHDIIGFCDAGCTEFSFKPVLDFYDIQTLLECLKDSYETNKTMALTILLSLSTEQLGLHDMTRATDLFEAALELASRARPTDGVTAAFLFRLLAHHPTTAVVARSVQQMYEKVDPASPVPKSAPVISNMGSSNWTAAQDVSSTTARASDVTYEILEVLTHQLTVELDMAHGSLLEAAAHGPMYGILFCIRSLIEDLDFKDLADEKWRTYLATLIERCLDLGRTVSPIVNNASPEGHLPNSTNPEEDAILQEHFHRILGLYSRKDGNDAPPSLASLASDVDGVTIRATSVTAQKLLLCGWRTMKEVSLTLGDICQRSIDVLRSQTVNTQVAAVCCNKIRVDFGTDKDLVNIEHILKIGDYFITLLAETKHRGAFEQAYVGFCKVCDGLWHSSIAVLHRLPEEWLQDLIDHIQGGKGSSALCSTRRSAGLPFMVQALVSSEPDIKGSSCFKQAMKSLLEMAFLSTCSSETKVHAFNILRALYRDTRLGQDVAPFIADGLQAAILGFKGKTWGVRNSATLLFSAIVVRIFGVQRSKYEISKKNCMTGNGFFQRFPSLYQFFLDELEEGSREINKNFLTMHPSLYPVLLILARLYPSCIEGTQSSLKLSVFVPYVIKCGASSVIKTRTLAAKALVPLVSFADVAAVLSDLFKRIPNERDDQRPVQQNVLHGTLLQINHLLNEVSNVSFANYGQDILMKQVPNVIHEKLWILTRRNPCPFTRSCFIDILDICLTIKILNFDNCTLIDKIYDIMDFEISNPSSVCQYPTPGMEIFQMASARMLLRLCLLRSGATGKRLGIVRHIVQMLYHEPCEVRWTAINFIYSLLSHHSVKNGFELPSLDVKEMADIILPVPGIPVQKWGFVKEVDSKWARIIMESEELATVLVIMATSTEQQADCVVQLYHLLPLLPKTFQLAWIGGAAGKCLKTASEKLEFILQKGECELRDDIRSALLHFSGFLIPHVYEEISQVNVHGRTVTERSDANPTSLITEWISAFLLCCSPEQSLRLRLTATQVLIENGHILLLDPKKCLGCSCLSVWSAAVLLLQDDDPLIKPLASILVEISSNQKALSTVIQPALALDILIGQFVNHFGSCAQAECLTTILDWMLRQEPIPRTDYFVDEEDRMFDKGQMNIYAEEINRTLLLRKHFRNLLHVIFQVRNGDGLRHPGGTQHGKEVRSHMLASLGHQASKANFSLSLPKSFTLDSVTLQVMSETFKGIMGNFKVTTAQMSTWVSDERRDELVFRDSNHFYLQDVIDMMVEELDVLLQDMDIVTDQTAFTSMSFDQTIVRMFHLVATVYCLCKYDNEQRDTLQRMLSIMKVRFGGIRFCNQLVHCILTDMKNLCSFHGEAI